MSKSCQKIKEAMKEAHAFFSNNLSVIKLHCIGEQVLVCS